MMQQSSMQHPSPAQSSPSNGFFGARASPLFSSVDQPDSAGDLPQTTLCSTATTLERDQAPPMQLAQSLECLSRAIRQVSDIRSSADNFLEGLDIASWRKSKDVGSCLPSEEVQSTIVKTYKTIDSLKSSLRELESSGVFHGAVQRYEDYQPWDVQSPVITTDGAMGAYAWKRQIAGQAAATAVDRTRLALKLFGEQKKRRFPRLKRRVSRGGERSVDRISHSTGLQEQDTEASTSGSFLSALLKRIQNESPSMTVTPYGRLEWSRQGCGKSSGPSSAVDRLLNPSKAENFTSTPGPCSSTSQGNVREAESKTMYMERVSVLEVRVAGVVKAVISLQPMGSVQPDSIAIFAADEVGSHVHSWGISQHKTYQRLSDFAVNALHYLNRQNDNASLELLLVWLYSYRSLFTKSCSTCQRTLALDPPTDQLLPPIVRSYRQLHQTRGNKADDPTGDTVTAFHIGCVQWAQTEDGVV